MRLLKREFKEYLQGFDPEETVGLRAKSDQCPLALYLNKRLGIQVSVGTDSFDIRNPNEEEDDEMHELPPWADRFIYAIDVMKVDKKPGSPVTAKEALKVLK